MSYVSGRDTGTGTFVYNITFKIYVVVLVRV